ncbi:CGNR zinc finger domain-containing protein [Streptomyces sp. NBC_01003]|uniref:CGNR zinc finger domain-containing protein n=1 Tax=Streptomyces sp. NBC_01003 TaxID=2903714 RepID=UPI00386B6221
MGTGLLGVVRTLSRERFRHRAAAGSDGMFVDTSKAGPRRYCTAEVCGNRRNMANYRARRLASGGRRSPPGPRGPRADRAGPRSRPMIG